jgi:hypothetical protein
VIFLGGGQSNIENIIEVTLSLIEEREQLMSWRKVEQEQYFKHGFQERIPYSMSI